MMIQNVNDPACKLYCMSADSEPDEHSVCPMRIQHNGDCFSICTFRNDTLCTIHLCGVLLPVCYACNSIKNMI